MKKGRLLLVLLFLGFSFLNLDYSFSLETKEPVQHLIQTITLDDFETPGTWISKYSRFRMQNWKDPLSSQYESSDKWMFWKKIPVEDYQTFGKPTYAADIKSGKLTAMGVRSKYYTKGYNWISIEPKQDLYLMGKLLSLRVWVWGGNYNYRMYVILKDFKDKLYQIDLGSLAFVGWKQLSADLIAQGLRQYDNWVPQSKPVKFLRFLIVSDVNERPDRFGIWLDDLQYDADLYEKPYYGKGLEKELDW